MMFPRNSLAIFPEIPFGIPSGLSDKGSRIFFRNSVRNCSKSFFRKYSRDPFINSSRDFYRNSFQGFFSDIFLRSTRISPGIPSRIIPKIISGFFLSFLPGFLAESLSACLSPGIYVLGFSTFSLYISLEGFFYSIFLGFIQGFLSEFFQVFLPSHLGIPSEISSGFFQWRFLLDSFSVPEFFQGILPGFLWGSFGDYFRDSTSGSRES